MVPPINRFLLAQDRVGWDGIMTELRQGRKTSHWMWFVFPQPSHPLATSETSRIFALRDGEVEEWLRHPTLGPRMREATLAVKVWVQSGRPLELIFGDTDAKKFRSCMRAFAEHDPWYGTVNS